MQSSTFESTIEASKQRPISRADFFLGKLRELRAKPLREKDTFPGVMPRTIAQKQAKRNAKKTARRIQKIRAGQAR